MNDKSLDKDMGAQVSKYFASLWNMLLWNVNTLLIDFLYNI